LNACNPVTFCEFPPAPPTTPCDDNNTCTDVDRCDGNGSCTGTASACDDNNPCTDDSADEGNGCACSHTNSVAGSPCDDGNACSGTAGTPDSCDGNGTCTGGQAVTCADDGNPCTTDSCDPILGCLYNNNTNACDDGNACTTGDVCGGGACGGTPVVCTASDQCHVAGTCSAGVCSNPTAADGTACDDGNAGTDNDVCTSGTCAGTANCAVEPKPKNYGYYKKLCKDGHSHPNTHEDALTDADAACVAGLTDTFAGISTVEDICAVLEDNSGSGDGADSKECNKAEQELMTTALNVCTGRICLGQEIDSDCSGAGTVLTTVQDSLDAADDILSDPGRDKNTCKDAKCLLKEINNGHGIHHTSLLLSKMGGDKIRLTWDSPVMDDGSGEATGYTIWRRDLHSGMPYTKIGVTNANTLTFIDNTAGVFEYEVTFTLAD
jgi:hypothetical protein